MLAGYIAIWATEVNGDNPEAADSNDDNDTPDNAEPAPDNTPVTDEPNDDITAVACDSTDDISATTCAPNCDIQLVNPAKLVGGVSNCVNVEATAVDVV